MVTLIPENGKYVRVRRGADIKELENTLRQPVKEAFGGEILERGEEMDIYIAKPLDSYKTVARKFGVGEEELQRVNFSRPIYPTCKIFVPRKKSRVSI